MKFSIFHYQLGQKSTPPGAILSQLAISLYPAWFINTDSGMEVHRPALSSQRANYFCTAPRRAQGPEMVVVNKVTILNPVRRPVSDGQKEIREDEESKLKIFSPLAIVKLIHFRDAEFGIGVRA